MGPELIWAGIRVAFEMGNIMKIIFFKSVGLRIRPSLVTTKYEEPHSRSMN